ncbi:SusC/RagA family TonB-linked outer membrane protein [Pedobacter rhodius]|uniref:SusC/RagA family TonB-linked outer membrane protein n=1 Tax=Pedobacter rhodius TaxID=3004098 RepID=A0ABT4KZC6_9SPHI|nr:SusC/RagA family TonB-linked outer membrane protein [Pedobacter sp. SJ11]MCZ4223198.1 SusC/RagA family TonB-linked outer membrane protein [Pedobacter sp. SJ11]
MKRKLLKCLLFFMILLATKVSAQDRTITGMVTAKDDGLPIPGVSVKVKGTVTGATSGANGRYSIKVPAGKIELVFSFVGYNSREIAVSNNSLDVALESDTKNLDEVVITAGGVKRAAREQGYASTRIDAETLTAGKSPTLAGGLVGKVPGLQISAVSSGVNPNYRLVLRGNRSITGNNQALLVLDGAVVPNSLLGNINPDDVEDITVLNGASGAALYGSDASNGALIITTKKGKIGTPVIKVSNTTALEQVSFYPKLQNSFGSGSTSGAQVYEAIENQQYGPAFDGSVREIGRLTESGQQQYTVYSSRNDKYDFWDIGVSNQTDISLSSATETSSTYLSAQYLNGAGTTPKDKFTRASLRFNGSRNFSKKFSANYNASYIQNKYDITSATSTVYNNLLNTPAQIPLLDYSNWQDPTSWGNPDNYYNDYYENPYWAIDNYRQNTKNDYLTGLLELKHKTTDWLDFTYRAALSNRYYENKNNTMGYTYTQYTLSHSAKTNEGSAVSDQMLSTSNFSTDFFANIKKDIKDFSVNALLGASLKSYNYKYLNASGSGLKVPELYNLGNITGTPSADESNYNTRQYGLWADLTFGYRKYLYVHLTGRNDWVSVLAPANRSFFYPAIDVSFIPTDALEFLKNIKVIDYIKVRAGLSKVGNVNVGNSTNGGAYSLESVFNSQTGYGYGTGYTPSSRVVSNNLKPEITTGYEAGMDFRLMKGAIDGKVTYYNTSSTGQAIEAGISATTGYTSFLLNTGELTNEGWETELHFNPFKKGNWNLRIGGNYTYLDNKLVSLSNDLTRIGASGSTTIYGQVGSIYPVIIGSDYIRDTEGRVVVDKNTGNPVGTTQGNILGNTVPKNRLGLDFQLSYKGLTFSGLFEYRSNYVQYASSGSTFDFTGSSARSAYYNREKFVFPNSSYYDSTSGTYVANNSITVSDGGAGFWTSSTLNTGVTSNYVYSGNYWKLRELMLAYKIPSSLLHGLKFVKSATISAQGRNLFIWLPKSNQYADPDYSNNGSDSNAVGITSLSQTPPTRYYGATISLTF